MLPVDNLDVISLYFIYL